MVDPGAVVVAAVDVAVKTVVAVAGESDSAAVTLGLRVVVDVVVEVVEVVEVVVELVVEVVVEVVVVLLLVVVVAVVAFTPKVDVVVGPAGGTAAAVVVDEEAAARLYPLEEGIKN